MSTLLTPIVPSSLQDDELSSYAKTGNDRDGDSKWVVRRERERERGQQKERQRKRDRDRDGERETDKQRREDLPERDTSEGFLVAQVSPPAYRKFKPGKRVKRNRPGL